MPIRPLSAPLGWLVSEIRLMGKGRKRYLNKTLPGTPAISVPNFRAFTIKANHLLNRIVTDVGLTPAFDPKLQPVGKATPFSVQHFNALWDTGATSSMITNTTAKKLNLTSIGTVMVNHAGGSSPSNTYLVNFYLPNKVAIAGVRVIECANSDFDAIVGMDIICRGDLSITNVNNQTCMSFRYPSVKTIDYVAEHKQLVKKD
jgi:hypothetical protein